VRCHERWGTYFQVCRSSRCDPLALRLRLTVRWVVVTALAINSHARVRSMLNPGWWESILSLLVVSLNFFLSGPLPLSVVEFDSWCRLRHSWAAAVGVLR
jgi:hypothetical protein